MRYLSDVKIDEYTDPGFLAERIPGFAQVMDATKTRNAAAEVSKFTKQEYEGWRHVASIPQEVAYLLQALYTPEELAADGGKVLLEWIKRNKDYYGSNPS